MLEKQFQGNRFMYIFPLCEWKCTTFFESIHWYMGLRVFQGKSRAWTQGNTLFLSTSGFAGFLHKKKVCKSTDEKICFFAVVELGGRFFACAFLSPFDQGRRKCLFLPLDISNQRIIVIFPSTKVWLGLRRWLTILQGCFPLTWANHFTQMARQQGSASGAAPPYQRGVCGFYIAGEADVEFLRAQGSQSGVRVWQHTLVG